MNREHWIFIVGIMLKTHHEHHTATVALTTRITRLSLRMHEARP